MTPTTITYVDEDDYEMLDSPVPRRGGHMQLLPGQQSDGYGRKITTDRILRFHGETRVYRVYAICFSNAASHYIIREGQTLYLRG